MENKQLNGNCGVSEDAEKLKRLEESAQKLTARQEEIGRLLEALKLEGKQNSYKFRELMGEKLTNGHVISFLKLNGLM